MVDTSSRHGGELSAGADRGKFQTKLASQRSSKNAVSRIQSINYPQQMYLIRVKICDMTKPQIVW